MPYLIYQIIKLLFLFISYVNSCQWSPTQCGCSKVPPSIHNRIVGGTPATPHSWPWMVTVREYKSLCGGVLISDRHVLTAAHCFENYKPEYMKNYFFLLGHHSLSNPNFVSRAKRIIIHNSYKKYPKPINDIALVELDRIINFTNPDIGFICLPLKHKNDNGIYPPIGKQTWVTGWGTTKYEGQSSDILRQVSVPITNNKGCQSQVLIPTKQICAGYDQGGKDSCQGDSGGPLAIHKGNDIFELVGIVSFGTGCAYKGEPGIYTRVSSYIDWIEDVIGEGSNKNELFQALMSSDAHYKNLSYLVIFIEILFLF